MNTNDQSYPHWHVMGTLLWGMLIFVVFNVAQAITMATWLQAQGRPVTDIAQALFEGDLLSVAIMGGFIACLLTTYIAIKFKDGSNVYDYLALRLFAFNTLPKWVLGLILIWVVAGFILASMPDNQNSAFMLEIYQSAKSSWLLYLAAVIAAPIYEEVFFRGFLFKGLRSSRLGASGSIILTSLCWAVIHMQYDYVYISTIFVLGLYLGYARYRSNSLLLPIFLHMLFNLGAMLQTMIEVNAIH